MSFTVIIPARFASQRLPGKPLLDIAGSAMIERVYQCASKSEALRIIVATDHQEIYSAVEAFGGEVMMTSQDHTSGTDRLQEVTSKLKLKGDDIVVNLQGDEPLMPAAVINQVANNLSNNTAASAATLCEKICDQGTAFNPNAVKVVMDEAGHALYFSRAPIPWVRDSFDKANPHSEHIAELNKHLGIYAYRVSLLNEFVSWPVSKLEQLEKLEQLRILSQGKKIHVEVACEAVPGGVDTPEDLERVAQHLMQQAH